MDEAWRRGPRRGCQRTVTGTALDLALMYKPSTVCTCTRDRAHAVRRWKMPIHVHHPLACQPSMIVCHNFAAGERALNYICHFSVSCASMVINFRKWKITIPRRIKLGTFCQIVERRRIFSLANPPNVHTYIWKVQCVACKNMYLFCKSTYSSYFSNLYTLFEIKFVANVSMLIKLFSSVDEYIKYLLRYLGKVFF